MRSNVNGCTLAIAYRSHGLGIAIIGNESEPYAYRHRLPPRCSVSSLIRKLVERAISQQTPARIVVELGSSVHAVLCQQKLEIPVVASDVPTAKRAVLGTHEQATNQELYQRLVDEYPKLRRLVTLIPGTTRLSVFNEARRLAPILAIALGLAAIQRAPSDNSGGLSADRPTNST